MEKWGKTTSRSPARRSGSSSRCLYQRNQLVKGEFRLNNLPVKLERITCPLLLLTADGDHLVLPKSTLAAQRLRRLDRRQGDDT